ncbi:MAG: succinate dehydrogenase, hydrophobic membrane anchor protein [Brevirhabdus sp.]
MRYLTDRKRATGMGSARTGTEHHWSMTVSSYGLLILVPLFVFTFGPMLGQPHDVVTEYYSRPFPAIVAGLTIFVGFMHFKNGVRVLIEDYVHGYMREFLIIAMTGLSWAAVATGLFALVRLAL